jgi:dTMP kinase
MKIITFEGIEGVGKSTQIQLLNNYLNEKGYKTEILREPGSTVAGEQIREILLNTPIDLSSESELLLMFAARAQLIKEKLLDSDKDIVLFDRFYDASVAYQGYGRGLSLEAIFNLIELTNCPGLKRDSQHSEFIWVDINNVESNPNIHPNVKRYIPDIKQKIETKKKDTTS